MSPIPQSHRVDVSLTDVPNVKRVLAAVSDLVLALRECDDLPPAVIAALDQLGSATGLGPFPR